MTADVTSTHLAIELPLTVQCPFRSCRQPRGWPCKSTGAWNTKTHAVRRARTAAWSDEVKVDAVRLLREETAARHAQGTALLRELANDPQVRESQRRTREAWARTDAEVRRWRRDCADILNHTFGCTCRTERPARQPLSPIRGAAPVADLAAHRRRRDLHVVPSGGGVA